MINLLEKTISSKKFYESIKDMTDNLINSGVDLDSMSNDNFVNLVWSQVNQNMVKDTIVLWGMQDRHKQRNRRRW